MSTNLTLSWPRPQPQKCSYHWILLQPIRFILSTWLKVVLPTPKCSRKHPPPHTHIYKVVETSACVVWGWPSTPGQWPRPTSQLGPELCSCFIRSFKVLPWWPGADPARPASGRGLLCLSEPVRTKTTYSCSQPIFCWSPWLVAPQSFLIVEMTC